MTIIAGVYARQSDPAAVAAIGADLAARLTRNKSHEVVSFSDDRCFLAKADLGLFGAPAIEHDPDGSVTLIAGDPVLASRGRHPEQTRADDTAAIHTALRRSDTTVLRKARAPFCGAAYDTSRRILHLMTDKIGLRPLYYFVDDEKIVFASALRILTSLPGIPLKPDLLGLTEQVFAGLPMMGRTPFAGISAVRPAHTVTVDQDGPSAWPYWRWDEIAESSAPFEDIAGEAYRAFRDGIALRLGHDKATVSFLSGGLDSRCIVACLRDLGADVHSFNFGPRNVQDKIFSRRFAEAAGTIHNDIILPDGSTNLDFPGLISDAVAQYDPGRLAGIKRPRMVWHGFDGDFTVGLINLSKDAVRLIREGDVRGAVLAYIKNRHLFGRGRFITPSYEGYAWRARRKEMTRALEELNCADPGKNLFIFHLLEEARDITQPYLEDIDLTGVEFQYPFCDCELIRVMMSAPLDQCHNHAFYMAFFDKFPAFARSVPWQTYPGAPPCPIAAGDDIPDQWTDKNSKETARRDHRAGLQNLRRIYQSGRPVPSEVFVPRTVRAMGLAHRLGIKNYSYAFRMIDTFLNYWRLCNATSPEWASPITADSGHQGEEA